MLATLVVGAVLGGLPAFLAHLSSQKQIENLEQQLSDANVQIARVEERILAAQQRNAEDIAQLERIIENIQSQR